ncbi:AEC family transporter [Amphibacillus indicireducens]|uniref:AEC family transporter n=1 Tax=Amphibacillus indicireducens TaxID=1076330 RepID=A0ABP7VAJ0_9BACI
MSAFNQQFFMSVIIILLGFILKKIGLLKETDGSAISRLIFNLTLPALIIVSFHDLVFEPSLMILVLAGFVFGLVLAAVGIFVFNKEPNKAKGVLIMIVPGMNIGLFAYPLVEGIWGTEGIKYFGMLDAGNAFIVFGLTYLLGSYYIDRDEPIQFGTAIKKLTNSVPLMVYLFIFIIKFLQIQIPTLVVETASVISNANMPLSLLLLGLYLNFNFDRRYLKRLIKVMITRYGTSLIIGLLIFFFLPVSDMIRMTLLIGLSLPLPLTVIPYSEEFNYDSRFVVMVTNVTILFSFLVIWLLTNLLPRLFTAPP